MNQKTLITILFIVSFSGRCSSNDKKPDTINQSIQGDKSVNGEDKSNNSTRLGIEGCKDLSQLKFATVERIEACLNTGREKKFSNSQLSMLLIENYLMGKIYYFSGPSSYNAFYAFDSNQLCIFYGESYKFKESKLRKCMLYKDVVIFGRFSEKNVPDFIAADLPLREHSSRGSIYRAEESGQLSPEALAVYKSLKTLPASSDDSTRDGLCEFYFKDDPDELNYFLLHGRYQYPMRK